MLKWAKYFALKKYDVHVISFVGDESYVCGTGIHLHVVNVSTPVQLALALGAIRKLVRQIKPDIIHGHYIGLYGLAAALCGFSPVILTAWGSDILIAPQNLFKRCFVRYSLGKAECVTCDAEHMKSAMIKLGVPERKIKIIMFGVDTQKFSPGPRNTELLFKLGLSEQAFIVVSLRSFYPIYDIPTLIRAAAEIVKENPSTRVVLVGGGPQEADLRKLVSDLSIEKNVVFAGKVPYDDIPDYVRLGHVYVSTSLSDGGLASSTAEAMASGVLAVVSDNLDNRLWIDDGRNGLLFKPGDYYSLAEKILEYNNNRASAVTCAAAGRETIVERDDYFNEMAKMEAVYLQIAKS